MLKRPQRQSLAAGRAPCVLHVPGGRGAGPPGRKRASWQTGRALRTGTLCLPYFTLQGLGRARA